MNTDRTEKKSARGKPRKAKCLFCREKDSTRKVFPGNSDKFWTSSEEEMVKRIEESWAKSCIDSLCSILHITQSHPFRYFFLNASYCRDCLQLLRDVDFTLKSLKTLQQQVIGFRQDLLNNLGDNYNAIKNKERIVVNYKDIERPKSEAKNVFQYDEVIKMLFEKLGDVQGEWTSVDFLEQQENKLDATSSIFQFLGREIKKESTTDAESIGVQRRRTRTGLRQRKLEKANYTEDIEDEQLDSMLAADGEDESSIKDKKSRDHFHEADDPDWNMSDAETGNDVINADKDKDSYEKPEKTAVVQIAEEIQQYHCKNKISSSCDTGFCDEKTLLVHERKVHENDPKPYHCQECKMKYRFEVSLAAHMIKHRAPVTIRCPECDKTFTTRPNLKVHMRTLHGKKSPKCSYCGKEFEKEDELLDHENLHKNSDKPFQCVTCNESFSNRVMLKRHMRTHDGTYHECDICDKRFTQRCSMLAHKKTHDVSYVGHQCPQCDLNFPSKFYLDRHMNAHSTTKNFICDVCGAGFKWEKGLNLHYRRHTGDYPFICKVCGKGFTACHFLQNHEEIHSGILAYECKYCKKRFRAKNNLRQHEKTHEPKDPNRKPRIRNKKKEIGSDASEFSPRARGTTSRLKSVAKAKASCSARNRVSRKKNPEISTDQDSNTNSSIAFSPSSVDMAAEETGDHYSNPGRQSETLLENTSSPRDRIPQNMPCLRSVNNSHISHSDLITISNFSNATSAAPSTGFDNPAWV